MKDLIIGVTGINAVDNPGPGVGVARSLREDSELNVKVVGLAYDAMEPGIYLDWLMDKSYIMPYPSGGRDAYMERLAYIKSTYGLDFVIPSLDVELPFFTKYGEELENMGIKTVVPTMEQFRLRGKDRLEDVAKTIGIRIPATRVVSSHEDLQSALDEIGYPVMIKGAFYKAYCAYTSMQAASYYNSIVAEWGYPIIVQQMVKGEELNVVGLGDGTGENLGMVGIKKMGVTSLGKIWTGVTIRNEEMLEAAAKFISEYKWKGAFELECMVDSGEVYLIEINPRLPAWSFFATGVGVNLPSNMLRSAFDMPIPKARDYESGKLYVRYTYEVVTDMKPFQEIVTTGEYCHEDAV